MIASRLLLALSPAFSPLPILKIFHLTEEPKKPEEPKKGKAEGIYGCAWKQCSKIFLKTVFIGPHVQVHLCLRHTYLWKWICMDKKWTCFAIVISFFNNDYFCFDNADIEPVVEAPKPAPGKMLPNSYSRNFSLNSWIWSSWRHFMNLYSSMWQKTYSIRNTILEINIRTAVYSHSALNFCRRTFVFF